MKGILEKKVKCLCDMETLLTLLIGENFYSVIKKFFMRERKINCVVGMFVALIIMNVIKDIVMSG